MPGTIREKCQSCNLNGIRTLSSTNNLCQAVPRYPSHTMALIALLLPPSMLKLFIHQIGTILTFFLALLLLRILFKFISNEKLLPPGPWGVPLLGFLPFLGGAPIHKKIFELSKKYGPVLRLRMGCKSIVFLSNLELIKEAFWKEEMTGRPTGNAYDLLQGFGVINVTGDRWKKQRKFLCTKLRALGAKTFGPGTGVLEEKIKGEVNCMLERIGELNGKPAFVDGFLNIASANIVFKIMMSERFPEDNPLFKRIIQLPQEGFELFMKADLTTYVPATKYLTEIKQCMEAIRENRRESINVLGTFLRKKRKTFDPDSIKDILDAYLYEEYVDSLVGKHTEFGEDFDQQLIQIMLDLFTAGEETVKKCVSWTLLIFLHNRDILEKVKKEMDSVVGRSRMPELKDRPSLPYTEATINEVLRRESIVPLGTPHACTKDSTIGGFLIPKGTIVFSSIFSCHMNPDVWEEPEKFRPERFIDADGKCFKPKGFIPFGVGKRMCLGEMVARNEIFLFVTSIIHAYDIECVGELPSLEGRGAITNGPKPYKLSFIKRDFDIDPSCDSLPNFTRK